MAQRLKNSISLEVFKTSILGGAPVDMLARQHEQNWSHSHLAFAHSLCSDRSSESLGQKNGPRRDMQKTGFLATGFRCSPPKDPAVLKTLPDSELPRRSVWARILKKMPISLENFNFSLEIFNLAWKLQSRMKISILTLRIPHKNRGLVGGSLEVFNLAWKCHSFQSRLKISISCLNPEFFQDLGPLG